MHLYQSAQQFTLMFYKLPAPRAEFTEVLPCGNDERPARPHAQGRARNLGEENLKS